MKVAVTALALIVFFGIGIAIKTWQYQSCLSDGMSPGTCLGIVSR